MLRVIKIKNFALIENAEIPFEAGLNVLSGETGAGKSIILEAISLLLGGRASLDVIRAGSDEAIVEGYFDIKQLSWLRERMKEVGLDEAIQDSELLIKRSIHRNGKNRIYINGEIATLNMLQRMCEGLVDLCGQNEHQSLFKQNVQIDLLDRYASLNAQAAKVREQFQKTMLLREEWEVLKRKEEERVQRLEFIKFQISELKDAALKSNEDEDLQNEKKLLQSHEQRLQLVSQIEGALDGEEGAMNSLKLALSKAKGLAVVDVGAGVEALVKALESASAEIEEASSQTRAYLGQMDLRPGRLEQVQERLSVLTNLKRKYGQTVEQMIEHKTRLSGEIDLLENLSERLEGLQEEFATATRTLKKSAEELFLKRKKGSELFSKSVEKELKELRMGDASMCFELSFDEESDVSSWGPDTLGTHIELQVQTNLGEGKKPIQKIISGGELSRLMLAIRRVILDKGGIGVYLFDEIDAGLGGQTAFTVGKKLKSVAQFNQVICITHVPQVAVFADHHLSIAKQMSKGRTVTTVQELNPTGRREEIARMLGSEKLTPAAIKNAKDLLQSAQV
ncbi:MAG: DNA repair protein RecN [Bdellovibrionales bacterium]|nr:DNA repair protein RecN [Bdellovibrionales bacterium]